MPRAPSMTSAVRSGSGRVIPADGEPFFQLTTLWPSPDADQPFEWGCRSQIGPPAHYALISFKNRGLRGVRMMKLRRKIDGSSDRSRLKMR